MTTEGVAFPCRIRGAVRRVMASEEAKSASPVPQADEGTKTPSDDESAIRARRRLIKTGATLVPLVYTLHAIPAWAQTDYTATAYRYGTNAGLCRNPHFNPRANPNSHAGREFVPCPPGQSRNGRTR